MRSMAKIKLLMKHKIDIHSLKPTISKDNGHSSQNQDIISIFKKKSLHSFMESV